MATDVSSAGGKLAADVEQRGATRNFGKEPRVGRMPGMDRANPRSAKSLKLGRRVDPASRGEQFRERPWLQCHAELFSRSRPGD